MSKSARIQPYRQTLSYMRRKWKDILIYISVQQKQFNFLKLVASMSQSWVSSISSEPPSSILWFLLFVLIIFLYSSQPEYKVADPICTFLFSVLVLGTTLPVTKDVFRVLLEGKNTLLLYVCYVILLTAFAGTEPRLCFLQALHRTFMLTLWESCCCLWEEWWTFTVCTCGASTWITLYFLSMWLQVETKSILLSSATQRMWCTAGC